MRDKLTDAQFGALCTLREHGPKGAVEVLLPPAMDGSRKFKLECHFMAWPTLDRLEQLGLINVQRGVGYRPKNAVGKSGKERRELRITITDKGLAALVSPTPSGITGNKTEVTG